MKLCRFDDNRLGVALGEEIADVSAVLDMLPTVSYPLPRHDLLIERLPALRPHIERAVGAAPRKPLAGARLLSPVANPGKLVAAPVNYLKHLREVRADPSLHHNNSIAEIERAGLFLKATSSLAGAAEGIRLNQPDRRTDHEVELAVVIGSRGKDVPEDQALTFVAGYCIGLDITIRGPEERSLRKSPDGYSVLGPWLVTADELSDPSHLAFSLSVNGLPRQRSNTSDLILGVKQLIAYASRFYTLHPGDVIYTGTPEGVGPITPGDWIEASIEGIGSMRVRVE